MSIPSSEILERFRVRVIAPLGGRLNQHWLVTSGNEQLVLRRWATSAEDIDYELRLLTRIAAIGWPVAPALEEHLECAGHFWSLFPLLPGDPSTLHGSVSEQRARGRLLAEFHYDLASLGEFGQRKPWRRCEEILGDLTLDRTLTEHERTLPEEVRLLRWHLNRARERIAGILLQGRPGIIIHGDFTPWNLRFQEGRLSGILDFELAHWDHRVGDFALSWRGKYDNVIHGYAEVSPLAPEEWELLTPLWWAFLLEQACQHLRSGTLDDGWIRTKLLLRSPLMGPDAIMFR
jgi:Ser/Thr protein kinase RdoA (MazF antagonist)